MRGKWREHLQVIWEGKQQLSHHAHPTFSHQTEATSLFLPSCPPLGWPWLCPSLLLSWQDSASSALAPPSAVYTAEEPGAVSQQAKQGQHHPASSAWEHSKSCLVNRLLPGRKYKGHRSQHRTAKPIYCLPFSGCQSRGLWSFLIISALNGNLMELILFPTSLPW